MKLTKFVFLGGVVVVLLVLFSSQYFLRHPKSVQWVTVEDLSKLFIPQHQERAAAASPVRAKSLDSGEDMAAILHKKVRVLCWIMTSPNSLAKKAKPIYETWAQRCNVFLFISSAPNETVPNVVALEVKEGRDHLTMKTMKGFEYAWDHYQNQADWFMKADDDTYVIVENLRYLLAHYDPAEPIYFGHHFKTIVKQGYMSGGGGYVLSKEALRRVVTDAIPKNKCAKDHGAEDVNMGLCLESVGVKPELSVDTLRRESFHPFGPGTHYAGGYPSWYYQYTKYGQGKGKDCCSEYSISFHYVDPNQMYVLDYLIYRLKTFGRIEKYNLSLINSIFNHPSKKPYIQTIAMLPTGKPEKKQTQDNARIEKVKEYLVKHNIKVVQKKGEPVRIGVGGKTNDTAT